jgi:hypothetical protein
MNVTRATLRGFLALIEKGLMFSLCIILNVLKRITEALATIILTKIS